MHALLQLLNVAEHVLRLQLTRPTRPRLLLKRVQSVVGALVSLFVQIGHARRVVVIIGALGRDDFLVRHRAVIVRSLVVDYVLAAQVEIGI